MKRLLRAMFPAGVRETISIARKHRRARAEHLRMLEIGQEIREDLLEGLVILPSRTRLLEHLPSEGVVAELGVAQGGYSEHILRICQPRELHLIDLWDSATPEYSADSMSSIQRRLAEPIELGSVRLHRGCSWERLLAFPDNYFDWVYVDAAHDYDSVKKDLAAARMKVRPAGYVCGHDYVLWSGDGLSRFGVVEAVNEFCNDTDSPLAYLTNQLNRHLSFAIRLNK